MDEKVLPSGWRAFALAFGVLQVLALFLLAMIFGRIENIDARVGRVSERVSELEGKLAPYKYTPN
ncbi:MAG: hypothetical protein KIS67_20305 [Verrucomicrobiae bacterium]|nr:hypothetical protein [Verrucomicrobiae bacterium]